MAPSPSSSATVLAVMAVLVLLGMGCRAAGMTACNDCKLQCNSTCSAANFAGAGPCGADCSPTPGCSGCLSYYQGKCMSGCLRACKAQTPDAYDCETTCKGNCSNQSSLCGAVCGESRTCTACKDNYFRGCTSCCTAYCKCHCV
ncbi:hypothetical protein CFC21_055963 [Triticum aestivum]|uniref:Uncharacterized protein n=2 Tax=Triticum aestivum TaxID=4565 RepID=A0A9R1GI00_WHEAT|nr:hypothetical protein CFC21_055949 [Triticum aestivum]KAF7046982.1 hypothetical protein CFC21_055963 [Triticum aestivum]